MIDISSLLCDPDFCTEYTIIDSTGGFVKGRYIGKQTREIVTGVVRPTAGDDLDLLPEADRLQGSMTFYVTALLACIDIKNRLYAEYNSRLYKIIHVDDFSDNGFYRFIGTLVEEVEDGQG